MSQGLCDGGGAGTRKASPMKSGSAPGVPVAFDTRATISDEAIGKPWVAGATRSMKPSASTPTGWKNRLPRIAEPHRKGNAASSKTFTGGGFPFCAGGNRVARSVVPADHSQRGRLLLWAVGVAVDEDLRHDRLPRLDLGRGSPGPLDQSHDDGVVVVGQRVDRAAEVPAVGRHVGDGEAAIAHRGDRPASLAARAA